jgi:hypothetical protein
MRIREFEGNNLVSLKGRRWRRIRSDDRAKRGKGAGARR